MELFWLTFEILQPHERIGEVTGDDPAVEIEIMRSKIENWFNEMELSFLDRHLRKARARRSRQLGEKERIFE